MLDSQSLKRHSRRLLVIQHNKKQVMSGSRRSLVTQLLIEIGNLRNDILELMARCTSELLIQSSDIKHSSMLSRPIGHMTLSTESSRKMKLLESLGHLQCRSTRSEPIWSCGASTACYWHDTAPPDSIVPPTPLPLQKIHSTGREVEREILKKKSINRMV